MIAIGTDRAGLEFFEEDGRFTVISRDGERFEQWPCGEGLRVTGARADRGHILYGIACPYGTVKADLWIDGTGDVRLELDSDMEFDGEFPYPGPFRPRRGDIAVLPLHEGMAFPADEADIPLPEVREAYCGWYTSLQMWAIVRGDSFLDAALEDSLDAVFREERDENGLLVTKVSHVSEKGRWGYARKMRFMTGRGGITGAAKAYRALMKERGRLVTLKEKKKSCPNLDKIVGAANFWVWEKDVRRVAREMKGLGIDRVLWSAIEPKEDVEFLKGEMGFLVGRYNIFRDVATPKIRRDRPEVFARPEIDRTYMIHSDAYPDDIVVKKDGELATCWVVRLKDGTSEPMVPVCGTQYVKYAIPDVLRDRKERGYEAYFVDTLTCTALDECYSPAHPMTRSQDIKWRLRATEYMCDTGLVTGAEDMTDLAVPYVHYSEGLMSVGPYRKENAGYDFQNVYYGKDVPEVTDRYELNPRFRVPFFQLVFHDCVAAYWYWGDSDTTFPERMPRRDAFNALYGTLPLYGVAQGKWDELKGAIARSYPRATKVHALTAYEEMLSFEYVTEDKLVQRTRFANGVTVTANFRDAAYTAEDGSPIEPNGFLVGEGD